MHVPFCIFVRRADHLREVDDDRLPAVPSDEDVELVEVAVDEPRTREAHDEVHERRVQRAGGRHVRNLAAETQARGEPNRRRQAAGKGLTTAYRGYASMNSMRMQCLAWSTGRGTGKACSCRT